MVAWPEIMMTGAGISAACNSRNRSIPLASGSPTVGVVVPTGYSFNLDGTAIYLTMASLFIADALGSPLSVGEQIGLLVLMIVASKGAAGVTGAGLATLAGGLQSHRPDLLDGVGLIVGIDRFMSEARAVTARAWLFPGCRSIDFCSASISCPIDDKGL